MTRWSCCVIAAAVSDGGCTALSTTPHTSPGTAAAPKRTRMSTHSSHKIIPPVCFHPFSRSPLVGKDWSWCHPMIGHMALATNGGWTNWVARLWPPRLFPNDRSAEETSTPHGTSCKKRREKALQLVFAELLAYAEGTHAENSRGILAATAAAVVSQKIPAGAAQDRW